MNLCDVRQSGAWLQIGSKTKQTFVLFATNINLKCVAYSGPPESVLCRAVFAAITTTNLFGYVSASFAYLDTELSFFLPIPQIT